ncbi:MAG: class I SAM-dependent methyltransferase [Deltaproteobacteria bacterium]|nr:class I SAM-dependent methyltransferase [Deltaproteobacteria bacterium]
MKRLFDNCEICGGSEWTTVFNGRIRDGAFGTLTEDNCFIGKCSRCGVERLNESACKDESFYKNKDYRLLLNEPEDAHGFLAEHDILQLRNLSVLWPDSIRDKCIADIGCAAGSFLDHVSGLAGQKIAIEPCEEYHEHLKNRSYEIYPSLEDSISEWNERVDYAFCFSVIEHVQNPRAFLSSVRDLLKPGGKLIVSTPNRRDILMDLKGDEYRRFFYRTVHRYYFDRISFEYCAEKAGLAVIETRCVHRFGISNAMAWLRDGRPTGDTPLKNLDNALLDNFWKGYLESIGAGDYLYFRLQKK